MKTRYAAVAACVAVLALLAGCPNPLIGLRTGSLTLTFQDQIGARTLLPPLSMEPASYTVSGTGPAGASFSQSTTDSSLTIGGLAFGEWTLDVQAFNTEGTLIGSGQATVVVHTGETTTVPITVSPLGGNGTLELTVSWTASQVESPSILASLVDVAGLVTSLDFSTSGAQGTYSGSIPTGYQTLSVQLQDNGILVMGAVEVVRIVKDQSTSGLFSFTDVNQPGGSIQVSIDPELGDPIPVSISGVAGTVVAGSAATASASVGDGTAVSYVWYLNGQSVATGSSYALGALAPGLYRLDVTAFSADGTRAGSATASFQVTAGGPPSGTIVTVAGNGTPGYSGDGGPATDASLYQPMGLEIDGLTIYIADYSSNTVRRVGADGVINTVAGTGVNGYSGDGGPAVAAVLSEPVGIALDSSGNLYVAEYGGHRIRKVSPSGIITTFAGTGVSGYSGDGGPAVSANLSGPSNVFAGSGNLYIADTLNGCVRMVDSSGTITTVAGTGTAGFSGDGGPAVSAQLDYPFGLILDATGNLYLADTYNLRVRRVDVSGTIVTVAGTGALGYLGDGGPATGADLSMPTGLTTDGANRLVIADFGNHAIRRVDAGGIITTIAGDGVAGYGGDGADANAARLSSPVDVALDSSGNLYIADTGNSRVRKILL